MIITYGKPGRFNRKMHMVLYEKVLKFKVEEKHEKTRKRHEKRSETKHFLGF